MKKKIRNLSSDKNYKNPSDNEDYEWVNKNNKSMYDYYKQFPFNDWIKIIKDIIDKKEEVNTGKKYQNTVIQILLNDIFKDCELVFESKTQKLELNADFIVKEIYFKDLNKILSKRYYMIKYYNLNFEQNSKLKIIGEICNNIVNKNYSQIDKYCDCVWKNQNTVLMLIFDYSFQNLFNIEKLEIYFKLKKIPIIYAYIPKLYREDCYQHYNNINGKNKIEYKNYIKALYNTMDIENLKKKSEDSEQEKIKYEITIRNLNKEIKKKENDNKMKAITIENITKDNKKKDEEIGIKNKEIEKKNKEIKFLYFFFISICFILISIFMKKSDK